MTANVPGPTEILPARPDAIIDLQTLEGAALVGGQWRYSDTTVLQTSFVAVGPDLGPSGPANRTYEVIPHAQAADFDDTAWTVLSPPDTQRRLSTGRVCFNWYRITVTLPEQVGDLDVAGSTVVFETVVDDYAEVWVNGSQPLALGDTGGQVVAGFNTPNRVVLTHAARPGQRFTIADPPFGLPATFTDPKKELPFSGVFAVRDGVVSLITPELAGPNGIALSPDERHLYVGNWDPDNKVVMRYTLGTAGTVTASEEFFDMTGADGEDAIDGLKVDTAGNVYVCGPSGIWLLSPGGEHLGTLRLPESPHNLAWGDQDARTLYITALTSIYRIRLAIPGVRPV